MTKIILIGCGRIATKAHIPALQQLQANSLAELCGVCDLDANRARATAEKFNIPYHSTDWRQLVKDCGAQAVSICLPPGPNVNTALSALRAGLHVLCEKPPGRDLVQAEKLALAASEHPESVNLIAFNRRYAPLYVRAMENSLRLGAPHTFYGRFTRPGAGQAPSNTASDWLTSDGSHAIDLAVATIGFPHKVSVARRCSGSGPENVWVIQLLSAQGAASIIFDFAAGQRVERFEWTGPGYNVTLELPDQCTWAQAGTPAEDWKLEPSEINTNAFGHGFVGEYQAFINAIAGQASRPAANFIYAPAFMHLIQTLLSCPSNHTVEVQSQIEPQQYDSLTNSKTIAASPVQAQAVHKNPTSPRPVVQILQFPSEQTKFFSVDDLTQLSEKCELHLQSDDAGFPTRVENMEAFIAGWKSRPLSREELDRATALKLAIVLGVSPKGIFPEMLLDRGILVCTTADIIGRSVAEHCLLLTLAGLRRLCDIDQRMRHGEWPPRPAPAQASRDGKSSLRYAIRAGGRRVRDELKILPGATRVKSLLSPTIENMRNQLLETENSAVLPKTPAAISTRHDLHGQTVGLIGWGNVARHFAKLLQSFNCQLLVHSQHADSRELENYNARCATLGEVLSSCRVISLHQGLTERTRGALGSRELALLRPGTLLVNTARGALFDEAALLDRLSRGDILAALDVFHEEPLPADHPLRSMRNAILSPHNANVTPECHASAGKEACKLLLDWLEGRPVPTLDTQRIASMS